VTAEKTLAGVDRTCGRGRAPTPRPRPRPQVRSTPAKVFSAVTGFFYNPKREGALGSGLSCGVLETSCGKETHGEYGDVYSRGKFYGNVLGVLGLRRLGPVSTFGQRAATSSSQAAKGGSRRLYRAVEPEEVADLRATGQFRPSPTGSESKYFYGSRKEAARFARAMNAQGYRYNRITSGVFDPDLLGRLGRPLLSGAERGESFTVPNQLLPQIRRTRVQWRRP